MFRATTTLRRRDLRHFVQDLTSGNVRPWNFVRYSLLATSNVLGSLHPAWGRYPTVRGLAGSTTPTAVLNLMPGEWVEVRSKEEVMRTLDTRKRNRGLFFDVRCSGFVGSGSWSNREQIGSSTTRQAGCSSSAIRASSWREPRAAAASAGAACFAPVASIHFGGGWLKRVAETSSGQREQS